MGNGLLALEQEGEINGMRLMTGGNIREEIMQEKFLEMKN